MTDYRNGKPSGRYVHRDKPSQEILRSAEMTRLISYNCANNTRRLLNSKEHGRPAAARQHPSLLDGNYCSAAKQEEVEIVGRRYLCPYIGKEIGGVAGRRVIYECDAAARLNDEKRLEHLPREKMQVVKPTVSVPVKPSFWQKLFGT